MDNAINLWTISSENVTILQNPKLEDSFFIVSSCLHWNAKATTFDFLRKMSFGKLFPVFSFLLLPFLLRVIYMGRVLGIAQLKRIYSNDKKMAKLHRHLSNIDCLKARTACLVCFISTVNGHCKKRKRSLERLALGARA